MAYHWNWGVFLSPVSTGEPTTYLGWIMSGFAVTIALSLSAWVIALAVGTLMGVLRTVPNKWLSGFATGYVALFRNIPLIVQFFIWVWVVPELLPPSIGHFLKHMSPTVFAFTAAVVCLGLFTAARVCEQVRSGLISLPRGQRAAGLALGLTLPQTYRHVLLPTAMRVVVPPLTSEFLNVFKNSAVASTIGLFELSAQARQLTDYTAQAYESFIAVTVAYFLINIVVMNFMRWVEHKTRLPGYIGGK
jgi:glutamate/aspartate transport system permease protein